MTFQGHVKVIKETDFPNCWFFSSFFHIQATIDLQNQQYVFSALYFYKLGTIPDILSQRWKKLIGNFCR